MIWHRTCFVFAGSLVALSCAQAPTKTFTSEDVDVLFLEKNISKPLEITNDTVIIDVRAPFDYAVIHYPTAVNVQWSDFSDPTASSPGELKSDLKDEAGRLALAGVDLDAHVVVVGNGLQGVEGRVAWTLLYMGVRDVQTANLDKLGLRYSNIAPPPRENKPFWQPEPHAGVMVDKKEFLKARENSAVKIIDVRTPTEFADEKLSLRAKYSDMQAVNVPWTRFYTGKGRPNVAVKTILEEAHIGRHDRILLISNQGVRSGAVTYALLSLGYKNAANYAGGYIDLFNLKK